MRPSAIIPALCCAGALVLSFLCLFAGDKKNFMEDYHLITLNSSRLGENFVNTTSSNSNNPLSSLFHNITNSIGNDINDAIGDVAEKLGIEDFYSAHLLDYCFGTYTPAPLPNATVSRKDIHKNVTGCSNRTAGYVFNPNLILEQALNESGHGVTLQDLHWPAKIQDGIDGIRVLQKTVFVLYCIAIGLIALSLLAALPALLANGRMAAFLNVMLASLAFIAIGLASGLVTAVIVKAADVVNKYGTEVGVEAHKGMKFMILTWVATALMLIVVLLWVFETCIGGRRRQATYVPKHG